MERTPNEPEPLPKQLEDFAKVYSEHNKTANRLWLIAATLTLVLISSGTKPTIAVFGLDLDLAALTFVLCLVNIAYCSAHIQAYRAGTHYAEMVSTFNKRKAIAAGRNSKSFVQRKSMAPASILTTEAHLLVMPNYNRIYPIFSEYTDGTDPWYRWLKVAVDFFYAAVPIVGLCFAFVQKELDTILFIAIPLVLLSLVASSILLKASWGWARKKN